MLVNITTGLSQFRRCLICKMKDLLQLVLHLAVLQHIDSKGQKIHRIVDVFLLFLLIFVFLLTS